jgi:hypothetical protein
MTTRVIITPMTTTVPPISAHVVQRDLAWRFSFAEAALASRRFAMGLLFVPVGLFAQSVVVSLPAAS